VWVTALYDPALNLTYWGIGNPGPDWNPDQRPGDNLYFGFGGGSRRGYRQAGVAFFSSRRTMVMTTLGAGAVAGRHSVEGRSDEGMMWANRNGFFTVLDRVTGKSLFGTPFVKVNWAERAG